MITTDKPTPSPAPAAERDPLLLGDRCDSCGAQAFVAVQLDGSPAELLFCGHHFRQHEVVLAAKSARVHDERDRINAKPSVSATAD
jgi:hypothetical protein